MEHGLKTFCYFRKFTLLYYIVLILFFTFKQLSSLHIGETDSFVMTIKF